MREKRNQVETDNHVFIICKWKCVFLNVSWVFFFISSASTLPRIYLSSFSRSTSEIFLFDGWRSNLARTCELYCWDTSWGDTSLSFKPLDDNLLIVSRWAKASVVISWCFFFFLNFRLKFLLTIISPEETRTKKPPTPLKGTVAHYMVVYVRN